MTSFDSKTIRICLCLSGQMRNFEDNFSWLRRYDERVDVSVVVATWSERGGKLFGAMGGLNRMRGFFPDKVLEALPTSWATPRLFEYLPGLKERAIERSMNECITTEMIHRVLPGAVVHVESPLRFAWFESQQSRNGGSSAPDPFSMSMLYKIWQADLLRKNLESAQGRPFDVVIRARPDFPFEPPNAEFLGRVAPGDIYLDRFEHGERNVGDGFALGNSATMDVYGQFFMTAYPRAAAGQWRYVHLDFYEYLMNAGLKMKPYAMLGYSSDRLVDLQDVLSSIERNPSVHPRPESGYRLAGDNDVATVGTGATLADLLCRGEVKTADTRLTDHVAARLTGYVPERDGGFLHVMANSLLAEGDPAMAILFTAISVFEMPDGQLRPEVRDVYLGDFAKALRAIASDGGNIIDDASLLVEYCLAAANQSHPLLDHIVCFLSQSDRRTRAVDGIAAMITALTKEVGHWRWFIDYFVQRGDSVAAERITRTGLREAPENPLLNAHLALLLAERGANAAAGASASTAALSSDPWSVYLAGKAMLRAGYLHESEAALRRAIALYPADPDYYMELSIVLQRRGRAEDAIDMAREAAACSPEPAAHRHNHLGHMLYANGFRAEAEAAFREALRRSPSWEDVRVLISRLVAEQDRFIEAASIGIDVAERTKCYPSLKVEVHDWLDRAGHAPEANQLRLRAAAIWSGAEERQ